MGQGVSEKMARGVEEDGYREWEREGKKASFY